MWSYHRPAIVLGLGSRTTLPVRLDGPNLPSTSLSHEPSGSSALSLLLPLVGSPEDWHDGDRHRLLSSLASPSVEDRLRFMLGGESSGFMDDPVPVVPQETWHEDQAWHLHSEQNACCA